MPTGRFSGNGSYQIDVDAALDYQNFNEKYSIIYWRVLVQKSGSYGYTAWGNTGSSGWADSSQGGDRDLWNAPSIEYNFQNGSLNGTFMMAEGRFRVNHRADGTAEYFVNGGLNLVNLGSASAGTGIIGLPRLASPPPAPSPLPFGTITQTQIEYRFINNGDGGSTLREWQVGWGFDPNGPTWFAGSGGSFVASVPPATTAYFWARGRNDIGWGGWSPRASARSIAGARVKIDGHWREAVPYVKVNGVWRVAQPRVKVNGGWRNSI